MNEVYITHHLFEYFLLVALEEVTAGVAKYLRLYDQYAFDIGLLYFHLFFMFFILNRELLFQIGASGAI